jgi:hypothetical protein
MTFHLKSAALALSLLAVAACDGGGGGGSVSGIASLGADFVRAFNQNPNDTPLDAQAVSLTLTPQATPFNP